MAVARSERHGLTLPDLFIDKVSRLRGVKSVVLVSTERGLTIWTVLDRDPGNSALRYRIYDIEAEALAESPDTPTEFRLVNLTEYDDPSRLHLPAEQVIYERE